MKQLQIAIIGSAGSQEYPEESLDFQKLYDISYQLGYLLGQKGYYILTGGKSGIMLGASKGCREAGGVSIGFVKGSSRGTANEYVDIEIVTNMGDGGDAFLIPYSADGAIVVGGGAGTLKEIAGFYLQGKPVIIIKETGGWAEKLQDTYLDERQIIRTICTSSPEEAIEMLSSKLITL